MSLHLRGEIWHIDIAHKGQRVRESTGTDNREAAQRYHDERKAELWQRVDAGHTWQDACTAWLTDQPRSAKEGYRLRAIIKAVGDNPPLDALTSTTFTAALAGQSPGNWNKSRALIVAILNTAKLRGWLANPPHIPTKKVTAERIRFLTEAEWQRLYAELPDHLKPLAAFAVNTGLRRHNVTHLEWSQVDMARRVAWIHPDQAKAGKPIGVPLSDDALETLRDQIGKHEKWVFPTRRIGTTADGEAILEPQAQITTGWKSALVRAGIDVTLRNGTKTSTFRWHDLRHTWASWHVMSGTPMEVLQKLGGWASLAMVLKYAHLAPEYLAGYANNAKPPKAQQAA